ncbi:MAG: AEC family transporter [Ancalomicrobiaceae bacterium]|nr:AEC family transporter [Ancalomicrobiaceae bacterium]
MNDVITLALPFFGLIFIGYVSAKVRPMPAEGLDWLNFFIIYLALPALFFELIAKTPIEQLANGSFVGATTAATTLSLVVAWLIGRWARAGNAREAAIVAAAGSYSNIGYMGPGLTLAALGQAASVPTALIFCFDNALIFICVPLMMALAGDTRQSAGRMALSIFGRIVLHPFILATIVGVAAAAIGFRPPAAIDKVLAYLMQAAAPCALFTLGVTVGLRRVHDLPSEMPWVLGVKLVLHPLMVLTFLEAIGGFDAVWISTAVLMASLPPALNVFVLAQQYRSYVERASTTVLVGTLASVFTVTGVLFLVTHDLLPLHLFGR